MLGSMLGRFKKINQALPSYTKVMPQNNLNAMVQNRSYRVEIANTNPMNSSHEQSQSNPIIQVGENKVIQHPSINIAYCGNRECYLKPCNPNKTDCGMITKVEAIGHGTHADSTKVPNVEYLSKTDFNGQPRPQYGSFYSANKRVSVPLNEQPCNENATKEVNNNEEMLNNINMHKHLND